MKKVSLLVLFAFVLGSLSYGQLGIASATYTDGDIETDKYFNYYSGTQFSNCPGLLTVTLPTDALILSTDVSYDMTSDENSAVYKQKSQLRCVSPGGTNEAYIQVVHLFTTLEHNLIPEPGLTLPME